jgi:GntR family transcriptional regulator/MocR family aminotransferase
VYLVVREGGRIHVGDSVATPPPPEAGSITQLPAYARPPTRQTFMCGGCYFIYDPAAGLPGQSISPGTSFADIPASWRCPDCGTEKTTFRPNVQSRS